MKKSCFKGCFCSKEVKVKSCFPRPWRERVGGARERGDKQVAQTIFPSFAMRASSPSRGEAYGGFTLVELLVVVLIIGILAAVALPMYKHTVMKSKFSTVIPSTKSLTDAQEVFYLSNGEYAEDEEEIDVALPNTPQVTLSLSDKRNYKYVLGEHTGVAGAHYIMYQKHSKRFAGNIHCEADKNNDQAKWLCEKGLGGTLITGSISGSNFLTYLVGGDAGTDKFIREDCAEGYYDNNGTCTKAQAGYYADEGERKMCEPGTSSAAGATSCEPCPVGQVAYYSRQKSCSKCPAGTYADKEGSARCTQCPAGTYQPAEGASTPCLPCPIGQHAQGVARASCSECPAGKYADTPGTSQCKNCPPGTYQNQTGATSCIACPKGTYSQSSVPTFCPSCADGYYADIEGSSSCTKCPAGQTSNEQHTGCVPA